MSLIIPVRNGGPLFQRCLRAVGASTVRPHELLVVDDGSTDQTVEWAREAGAVILCTPAPGSGPAVGRNLAAGQASGEILYFCDADIEIRPETLSKIQADFAREESLTALFGSYDDQPGDAGFLSQYKNLFHHYVHQQGSEAAATFWSGCGAIRREVFLKLGGFSNRYRLPSIEDIELGYKLKSRGYRIRLDKSLQVKHLKKWTWRSLLHSDIVARGIPWTRLILREGAFLNDLNLQTHNRASVVVVYLTGLSLALGWGQPLAWLGALLGLALLLVLNRPLYGFFARQRGVWFTVRAVGVHWLYYLYNGISFGLGALAHILEREPRRPALETGPAAGSAAAISPKRAYALPAAALLLLATALRFHALGAQSMWLDELLEIGEARNAPDEIVSNLLQFGAMPLDYIAVHYMLQLGQQDFWLRILPAFWSVLSVALLYRLAGRLLGRGAGLLAAALLTASVFAIRYAQETRPYALFGLLSLVSFYFLFRGLAANRIRSWAGYAAATALCLYTHYFTLFMVAAQAVIAGLWLIRRPAAVDWWKRASRFGGAVGVIVLSLAVTPTFYNVLDVGRYFILGVAQPASLSEPAELKPNKDEGPILNWTLFDDQLLQAFSGGGETWRWMFLGLVVGGLALATLTYPRLAVVLLAWTVLPPALTLLFLIHRGTFFAVRYVTPVHFSLILLITVALWVGGRGAARRLPGWRWGIWFVMAVVSVGFSLERVNAYYTSTKEDWRGTGGFISANYASGDLVDAPLGGGVVFHYADGARPGRLDTTATADLSKVTGRLWVVVHPYIGPAEGGLRDWLAAQPSTVEYRIDPDLSVFVVDNRRTRGELLAEIVPPDLAITLDRLARQFADIGSAAQAETDYRRALELSGDPLFRTHYANFLREAGRADEAAQIYMAVLSADPQHPEALSGLGRLYFERGAFSTAATLLERATAAAPQDYSAHYFLWQSYERLGRASEAARVRDQAAQLVPDLIEPP